MLDKAVASRVVSSTTAKGSRVTKGPDGKEEGSHLGREQSPPSSSP